VVVKYHPTLHKCPEKSLPILILGPGETLNEEGEIVMLEGDVCDDVSEEEELECKSMGVFGSMGGNRTKKVEGTVGGVNVLDLIDSGATLLRITSFPLRSLWL
jgi:hypothetical protein